MRRGRPVVIVSALLLTLTWLLVKSRSPGQASRTRAQASLQALQRTGAAQNRAVLMLRAGLLLHYDSLPPVGRDVWRELRALEREGAALAAAGDHALARETRGLAEALLLKGRRIEHFTSDYAVLRNSTTYFGYLVQTLTRGRPRAPTSPALDSAHVLLRFVQSPESTDAASAATALATIQSSSHAQGARALADHGRIIVDLLPRVDEEVRAILTSEVASRVAAVQQALLRSAGAAEIRAQRFRFLLYVSAIVLLGYVLLIVARLRANAAELRRNELQLIQANKMTALGMLVSTVAHEINNPNQIVLTNAGVLANALDDVEQAIDGLAEAADRVTLAGIPYSEARETLPRLAVDIQESARRIERIVDDLKHFARPGVRSLDCFDLNDVVRRALRLLTYLIRRRTDRFDVQLADVLPPVCGNAQHLEQVTVNLVVNALEALPARDRGVTVSTRNDAEARRIVLEVRDEGVGMTNAQLARLGEAFFTTKGATGGTGLGIAIASSLVRLYDGRLDFEARPGAGACVTMSLPYASPDAALKAQIA